MTEEERNDLKLKIVASISDTERDISELEELTKPIAPENSIGRISRMDAINNKSINEAALVQARTKLDKLQFALDKCSEPDFGTCRRCGNAIPTGRLILMPESLFCVTCA
ncbi:MAG: TraR/DksA C4-type zinc finger protein [Flavobacteriales bacterium]|nr:TraR/DksA C4-type zinc finger protein [Flavobacteriales bacterium]